MDCLFCKIIAGEIPSYKIYENEYVLAFLDIDPDSDGHTLIIPKKHFNDIKDIDEKYLNEIFKASKIIIKLLEDKLNCSGITLLQNNGDVQEVKHFHLHVKPYYKNIENIKVSIDKDVLKDTKEIYELLSK